MGHDRLFCSGATYVRTTLDSPYRDKRRGAAQAGLALNLGFTIRRFQRQTPSNNPTYLARRERILEGIRLAGVPEG
jgi:hypothetical protein